MLLEYTSLLQQLFRMTSSGNDNEVVRSSIEEQDDFLLTMKTFDFTIDNDDDDDELDLPSQATNVSERYV